jgi:hypothetical protein
LSGHSSLPYICIFFTKGYPAISIAERRQGVEARGGGELPPKVAVTAIADAAGGDGDDEDEDGFSLI